MRITKICGVKINAVLLAIGKVEKTKASIEGAVPYGLCYPYLKTFNTQV